MAFINLNSPNIIMKKVTRNSKWECGAVEWNPHLSHAHIFANAVSFVFIIEVSFVVKFIVKELLNQ